MKIIEPGHVYRLTWLDGEPEGVYQPPSSPQVYQANDLVFVNREDAPHPGTQTQEVIRALIDRTQHCDECLRWPGNDKIVFYLRMALVLHEARALERKVEKGLLLEPENIALGSDGHFRLFSDTPVIEGTKEFIGPGHPTAPPTEPSLPSR
jgi:hypothetical protein